MNSNKILVILRHGEADFNVGRGTDYDRELSNIGKSQLTRLKSLFEKTGIFVNRVISSSAKRTRQTTEIICSNFESSIIEYKNDFYDAEFPSIQKVLESVDKDDQCVMVVGHNPGVSALVSYIADQGYLSIQPGMMVIIELTIDDWKHLGSGTGIVREVLQ
ncbi:phosphohistidine phosphatase SixA [Belliella baltica DSM 15883]|uniref:Phosphohistidine phosphatase SixA n=1 Tax=Belliella baltica (strain DSM 15883 / CIP 108006 / LMG 21964 / BA134) TaxID=866536 RepID=I3Z796_BELBD|nr:histidine phosphatase family protein [Belliella baltica]AFL85114.1 phosphohistidine phosphatase SixA [Belliella baltica DSM 15883]